MTAVIEINQIRKSTRYDVFRKYRLRNFEVFVGLLLAFCTTFLSPALALRLTFPPARDWNDFIDNQDSAAPCGVLHSANSPSTVLSAGNQLNVTWSLSYANSGGYRIELLRPVRSSDGALHHIAESTLLEIKFPNGSLVSQYHMAELTGGTFQSSEAVANPLAQWAMVTLPSEDCYGCTIRLIRQAIDLHQGTDNYLWSCADVNIATDGVNQCHGCNNEEVPCDYNEGTKLFECTCDSSLPYSGTYCEREDECVVDADCGPSNAKCIDIQSTNSPSRQCFCMSGWAGEGCQLKSALNLGDKVDLVEWQRKYDFHVSSTNFSMFWKIVDTPKRNGTSELQIEVALAAKTESYVAVGWRPSALPYQPAPNSQEASLGAFQVQSSPAPITTPPPLAFVRASRKVVGGASTKDPGVFRLGRKSTPSKKSPNPVPISKRPSHPHSCLGSHPNSHPSPDPPTPPLPPPRQVEVEVEPTRGAQIPASWAQDMTIGTAKGKHFRVKDAWSLAGSYSTPVIDTWLGGTDDITDANGHEEADGWSYFVFRRPLAPSDKGFDYSIIDDAKYTVVWAKGQTGSDSGREAMIEKQGGEVTREEGVALQEIQFYKADEMVSHGRMNAGVFENITLAASSNSDRPPTSPALQVIGNKYNHTVPGTKHILHWSITHTSVMLSIDSPTTTGWVSIGLSPSHVSSPSVAQNALVVVGTPGEENPATNGATRAGSTRVGDTRVGVYTIANNTLEGMVAVRDAESPVVDAVLTTVDGSTVLSCELNSTSGNGIELVVENGTRQAILVWAAAPDGSNKLGNHYVRNRGALRIDFDTGDVIVLVSDPTCWYQLHGLFMWASFGLLFPLSYICGRLTVITPRKKQHVYHSLHFLSVIAAFLFTIAASILGFEKFIGSPWLPLRHSHGLVGFVTLGLMVVAAVNGVVCRPVEIGSIARRVWARSHWVLGVALAACATFASVMGIHKYHDLTGNPVIILWTVYGVCLAIPFVVWFVLQFAKPHEHINARLLVTENAKVEAHKGRHVPHSSWPPENVNWPTTGGQMTNSPPSSSILVHHPESHEEPTAQSSLVQKDNSPSEMDPPILPTIQPHGVGVVERYNSTHDVQTARMGGTIHRVAHGQRDSLGDMS